MKYAKTILASLCLILAAVVAPPALVSAAGPVSVLKACGDNPQEGTVCQGGGSSVLGVIKGIINLLIMVAGIVSVIMIIVGGIKYSTSGGDSSAISSGKDTVMYAIIGLVISVMSFAIVNFVLWKIWA